jgi:hypothetical protein
MTRITIAAILLLTFATPALAAQLPGTDLPYATYRTRLAVNGWRPDPTAGCSSTPYPEVCTGNAMGTGTWAHPVDASRVVINLWPCRHGWCVAPSSERTP